MSEQIKAKPKFFYDNGCPICSQYRRLVERKIGDQVEYVPAQQNALR